MNSPRGDRAVVLVHGWPGLGSDYDEVQDRLGEVEVFVPDLLGFGPAFDGEVALEEATAESHARRLLRSLDDRGMSSDIVIAGYDIGSRIAQAALRLDPSRFIGAVLTPAYPGIGERAADPRLASVFWYQHFHREIIAQELIDGKPEAMGAYLDYLWSTWSGPTALSVHPHREEIIAAYSRPGAFAASVQWYRANRGYAGCHGRIDTSVTILWPSHDPLFPPEWADRLNEFFTNVTLMPVEGSGHFVPLEAATDVASAIRAHLALP